MIRFWFSARSMICCVAFLRMDVSSRKESIACQVVVHDTPYPSVIHRQDDGQFYLSWISQKRLGLPEIRVREVVDIHVEATLEWCRHHRKIKSSSTFDRVLNDYRINMNQEGHHPQPEFIATRLLAMQGLWICHEPMRQMQDQAKSIALMADYTLFFRHWLQAEKYELAQLFANDEFRAFVWNGAELDLNVLNMYNQLMVDVVLSGLQLHLNKLKKAHGHSQEIAYRAAMQTAADVLKLNIMDYLR